MDKFELFDRLWQINYFAGILAQTENSKERAEYLKYIMNATAEIYKRVANLQEEEN